MELMPVRIEGLKELRAALRAAEEATPREVTKALREGAKKVTARSNQLAPKKSGNLAANGRPFATMRSAGVKYTLPYAGVQEFATTWTRRPPHRASKQGSVTRGEKKAGAGATGNVEVHYTKNGPPPRFAYKAINELGPALLIETFDRLTQILKAHGWFK